MFVENSFKIDLVFGIPQLGTDIQKILTNLFWVKNKTNYLYECLGQNGIDLKTLSHAPVTIN